MPDPTSGQAVLTAASTRGLPWPEHRGRTAVATRAGGQCEAQVLIEEEVLGRRRWYPERCPSRSAEWSHRWGRGTGGTWSPANGLHLCGADHRWLHASPERAQAGGWALKSGADPAECRVWLPGPFPAWWLLDPNPPDAGEHVLRLVAHGPAPEDLRRVVPGKWAA